ncbi:MAG TPA: hypothetical protein VGM52_04495 [Herbaspirillum sp.]|jgi:hypothetical protein
MKKIEFVSRVFDIARSNRLRVKIDSRGHNAICFNEVSGTWLHEGHIGLLFDLNILRADMPLNEMNALMRRIAPGRSGAHKGMREIVQEIQKTAMPEKSSVKSQAGPSANT